MRGRRIVLARISESIIDGLQRLVHPLSKSLFPIIIALLIGAIVMRAAGYDPIVAYQQLFKGGFGSLESLQVTLGYATPIMLTALTFLVGVRSGVFNIGMEGQLYFGAMGAVVVGALIHLPAGIHFILTLLSAMGCGLFWALIPGVLKVWRNVNEILSTLMFNYVASFLVIFIILSYMTDPVKGWITCEVLETARFPAINPGANLSTAIFISIGACLITYLLLWRTRLGYELRLTGSNPDAARYAGIDYSRIGICAFLIGGIMAGLAGGVLVMGRPPHHFVHTDLGNIVNFGWLGLAVALIGRNHPLGVIPAALFVGGLKTGSKFMQMVGVPVEMVGVIIGIIYIGLAVPEALRLIREKLK